MKLSDYIISYLASLGIKHIFVLTGGAATHLVDSFKNRNDIKYICVQHEQAGAMAVDAYSRLSKSKLGAMIVTSGPGATNLITGICCSWFDSIPCLFLTGQVNTFESSGNTGVRQLGFQETDIVSIVKPITKYAALVTEPEKIKYHLDKAVYIAKSGRPGPVLLDIPMNVQRAEIDLTKLESFKGSRVNYADTGVVLRQKIKQVIKLIENAQRPIILAGAGIRLANATKEFRKMVELLKFPVIPSWAGSDLLPHAHHLRIGPMGVYGHRGANFAIQNADLLISIGSRIDTRMTGGKSETFCRRAKKIIVDIDPAELNKGRVIPDIAINSDAKEFINLLIEELHNIKKPNISSWIKKVKEWKAKYPICLPEYYKQKKLVNPYVFIKTLSEELGEGEVIITDAGGNLTWTMQTFETKEGQRLFSAFGNSPMGYSFPASIGASICLNKKPIVCIIGDGGFQINIQELETVVNYKLPIKIFIMNNHCYGIIKQFQDMYFGSRYIASDKEHGYSCPDFVKIARAYGIKAMSITNHKDLRKKIRTVLKSKGAVVCDVVMRDDEKLIPKLEFGKPIEDLTPYLDRKEFLANMIIKSV